MLRSFPKKLLDFIEDIKSRSSKGLKLIYADRDYRLFAVVYFVQGALGLTTVSWPLFLKQELGMTVAQITTLMASYGTLWLIKPLYGAISDAIPIFDGPMQIGEPSVIAKETGVLTVADFRPCDIALGGEGAPLTGYTDYLIFSSEFKNRAIINIGGITNITILPKKCSLENVKAFDIGPGNMCINEAMKTLYNQEYDKDGKVARSGSVNHKMLKKMLNNVYFKSVLKSTGRLHFGAEFVEENIEQASEEDIKDEDIIATFTEFTAYLIARNIEKLDVDQIILCGGGYKNKALRESIMRNCKNAVFKDIKDFGMTVDNREAIAFAILANETLSGNPSNLGSRKGVLGKIVLP